MGAQKYDVHLFAEVKQDAASSTSDRWAMVGKYWKNPLWEEGDRYEEVRGSKHGALLYEHAPFTHRIILSRFQDVIGFLFGVMCIDYDAIIVRRRPSIAIPQSARRTQKQEQIGWEPYGMVKMIEPPFSSTFSLIAEEINDRGTFAAFTTVTLNDLMTWSYWHTPLFSERILDIPGLLASEKNGADASSDVIFDRFKVVDYGDPVAIAAVEAGMRIWRRGDDQPINARSMTRLQEDAACENMKNLGRSISQKIMTPSTFMHELYTVVLTGLLGLVSSKRSPKDIRLVGVLEATR